VVIGHISLISSFTLLVESYFLIKKKKKNSNQLIIVFSLFIFIMIISASQLSVCRNSLGIFYYRGAVLFLFNIYHKF
jgi:Ca2+/Na+ antiporter